MQKSAADAGTTSGSWTISTETKNGVVTGFAVMSEQPKRAAPGAGRAAERRTGGVAGTQSEGTIAQGRKAVG